MSETTAKVTRRRTISPIWIVPIVAVALGAWMVWFTFQQQGPEITLVFSTAEGIEAGKTKIRARSVDVGLVSSVGLSDDLENVVVVAELEKAAERLLRQDTEFWVVRPRVGAGGVTGLGTILSGGYIELAPGTGKAGRREFVGLEDVPVTPIGTPGLHLSLVSDEAGSVSTGDPILYDGYRVGRVEKSAFDVETREMRYQAFIEQPYDSLVTTGTQFWNSSGVNFSATADGIELSTGSLQSLVVGGVTFGVPENTAPGARAVDGALFTLHPKEPDAEDREYRESIEYVVRFARSVRGLRPGAPVEYRGLHAGQVERLLLSEMIQESGGRGEGAPIPVLITLQPGRLEFGDDAEGRAMIKQAIENGATKGLRATLATGNLLTGSLYIALDTYPDAAPAEVGSFAGRPTIPTISSGLEGLQQQAQALLEKLNALPVEDVVGSADATLQELNSTVAALNAVIRSDGIQSLPDQLELTLAELDRTLRKVSDLAASLESQPSSLIFSRTPELDPEPAAGAP